MEKRRSEANRQSQGRRFASCLLLLLPGLMFLALLAPAAVSVQRKADREVERDAAFRSYRAKRSLGKLAPRAVANAPLPDLRTVEVLFSGGRYLADEAQNAPLPEVAAGPEEEPLVLDEDPVDDYVADSLFDSSIQHPVLTVDFSPIWDPVVFDIIPSSIIRDGYQLYDDFHGTGIVFGFAEGPPPVIPEPHTGALVALGLVTLALRARMRD